MIKLTPKYVAGLVDADGTIGIYLGQHNEFWVAIGFCNLHKPLVLSFKRKFGGSVCRSKNHKRPFWNWSAQKNAAKILHYMLPYLVVKRAQAKLALIALEHLKQSTFRGGTPGRTKRVTFKALAFRKSLVRRCKKLKKENFY